MQGHNRWRGGWPLLVTLAGWALLLGGLYRMGAPAAAQPGGGMVTYGLLAGLVAAGGLLSLRGYGRERPGGT